MAHDQASKTLPSVNVASSPLKPSAMEACGNETSTSINVASSSPLKPPTTESTRVFNQTPEKQPFNLKNQDPGQTQSSPSRWSVYVKKCHEMILFLTASALAFLPIRFMIDEYTKCGSILCVQHYVEGVHTLLGDFKKLDPFILFALAYAGFYILSSGLASFVVLVVAATFREFRRA
ncbi:hypothetical protein F2Q70_00001704 [Brassica cretica]|uniref:Uncharacterized protein n=1 Tax=Brassica cretica TaxID=69181 RepID=A0A8S9J2J4_BRACR|nr:hypothetical protein F2Q70_00001704 [Brassica cretica]